MLIALGIFNNFPCECPLPGQLVSFRDQTKWQQCAWEIMMKTNDDGMSFYVRDVVMCDAMRRWWEGV